VRKAPSSEEIYDFHRRVKNKNHLGKRGVHGVYKGLKGLLKGTTNIKKEKVFPGGDLRNSWDCHTGPVAISDPKEGDGGVATFDGIYQTSTISRDGGALTLGLGQEGDGLQKKSEGVISEESITRSPLNCENNMAATVQKKGGPEKLNSGRATLRKTGKGYLDGYD